MKRIQHIFIASLLWITACNAQPVITLPYTARITELSVTPKYYYGASFYVYNPGLYAQKNEDVFQYLGECNAGLAMESGSKKKILVFTPFIDVNKAKELDRLTPDKQILAKNGVTGMTPPTYWNVIYYDTCSIRGRGSMMIVMHVKDFDRWKKSFDADTTGQRAAYGFFENMIARGTDDPNRVCVMFIITDMDKAKARMASHQLKAEMTMAGVGRKPKVTYFKWLDPMLGIHCYFVE